MADEQLDWTLLGYKSVSITVVEPSIKEPSITLTLSEHTVNLGETVTATVTVKAQDPVSGATVYLYVSKNGTSTEVGQKDLGDIAGGETKTATFTIDPSKLSLKEGDTVQVFATLVGTINGQTVKINSNTETLSIAQGLKKPVLSISVDKNSITVGETVEVTLTVNNENGYTVTADYGILMTDPSGNTKVVAEKDNQSMAPHSTAKLTYQFKPTQTGTYQFRGQAIFKANGEEASAFSNSVVVQVNEQPVQIKEPSATLVLPKTQLTAGESVKATVKVKNNDENHSITDVEISITANGNELGHVKQATSIGPGEEKDFAVTLTFNETGQLGLVATVKATFDSGQALTVQSNTINVTVNPAEGDSASLTIKHPDSATAGDTVVFTITLNNTGTNTITDAKLSYSAVQTDENGNTVLNVSNTLSFQTPIEPGQDDTLTMMIQTKEVAGTLTVNFKADIKFSDGKTLTKTATSSVTLNAGGETPAPTPSPVSSLSSVLDYLKEHPLIAGGIVAGVVLLLLLGKRSNPYPPYPYPPAYPPAYPPVYPQR